jgi:hypothetical protein
VFVVRVYVPMLLVRVLKLCSLRWVGRGGSRICESVGRQEGAVCYVARGIFLRGTGAAQRLLQSWFLHLRTTTDGVKTNHSNTNLRGLFPGLVRIS